MGQEFFFCLEISMAVRGMMRMPLISPAQSYYLSQLPLLFVPSRNNDKNFIAATLSVGNSTAAMAPLISISLIFTFFLQAGAS
jgi:hypothetical protein